MLVCARLLEALEKKRLVVSFLRTGGNLSAVQLDAIALMRKAHEEGFAHIDGDGTGAGKGRTLVGPDLQHGVDAVCYAEHLVPSSLIAYRGCPKCLNSCCGGDAARRTFTSCTAAQFVAYDPSSFCNVLE